MEQLEIDVDRPALRHELSRACAEIVQALSQGEHVVSITITAGAGASPTVVVKRE